MALSHEGVEQLSTCKAFLEFYFTNWRNEKSNWEGVRDDEEWMKRMLVFLETLIRLRGDAQGFLLQRLRGVFADFVAHTYPALVNLEKKKKLKKAIRLVIQSYKTLKVSEGFLSFESSARRAPSAFQACNRDTIKNKTLEALKSNTEHVETQPSVTLAAGRSGASFSLCLEQKNASSSGGLVTANSSQIPEVIGGLHDLTLVLEEEARKDGTVGSLVHSILHEVIDEAVALHERERGPYGELGFMIPSSWLLEEAGLMWRIKRAAGEDR